MVSVVPPPIEPVEGETDEMMSTASMGVEVWTAVVSADAPCCTVWRRGRGLGDRRQFSSPHLWGIAVPGPQPTKEGPVAASP
eukprot:350480-Chlamydomonas_euryale.AAC.2